MTNSRQSHGAAGPVHTSSQQVWSTWCHWVPDSNLWEQLRLSTVEIDSLERRNIRLSSRQDQVLQVLRVPAEPVLQALNVHPTITRLLTGQELEDSWQGSDQLQQLLLEVVVVLLQCAEELLDGGVFLGASFGSTHQLGKVEGAKLVELEDGWHGGKDETCIQAVTLWGDNSCNLQREHCSQTYCRGVMLQQSFMTRL